MHYVKIAIAVIIIASIASASLYGRHHALRARSLEAALDAATQALAVAQERAEFYEKNQQKKIAALALVIEKSAEASKAHAKRVEDLLESAKNDPILANFLRQPVHPDVVRLLSPMPPCDDTCAPTD